MSKKRSSSDHPPIERLHLWHIQAVRDLLLVALVVGILLAGYALRAVTIPLLVALFLSYLCEPLVARCTRTGRISRPVMAGSILALGSFLLFLCMALLLPRIVDQAGQFIEDVESGRFRERVMKVEQSLPGPLREDYRGLVGFLPEAVTEEEIRVTSDPNPVSAGIPAGGELEELIDRRIEERMGGHIDIPVRIDWSTLLQQGAGTLQDIVRVVVRLGMLAFLIPFYFFFFCVAYPRVVHFGEGLIPVGDRHGLRTLLAEMDAVVAGFVRGRIMISIVMGILLSVGWMQCGVPYAILLGITVGFFCAVPYLGVIGVPVAAGLLFLAQQDLVLADADHMAWWGILLWPTLVFAIVQIIEGYVLVPVIAGKVTGLDPVTLIVAVLAGGSVLGIYGMLISIPLAACLKILTVRVLLPRIYAWGRGEEADPLPIRDT